MIKKLNFPPYGTQDEWINKINELVDAVNELQIQLKPIIEERESQIKVYEETMEMVKQNDPYEEQRKWIGYLCVFKNQEFGANCFDTLIRINDFGEFESCRHGVWKHCEPVKPDDEIIYKGSDNE